MSYQNKRFLLQEIVERHVEKAIGETRDRCADVLSTVTEKCDSLEDMVTRKLEDLSDKMVAEEWSTPESSNSRSRRSSDTPRRPDKIKRRSQCPFCSRTECKDPVACGLRLKWTSRLAIKKSKNLCQDSCCFKQHRDKCHKAGKIRCGFCNRIHIKLWCIHYAKDQGML